MPDMKIQVPMWHVSGEKPRPIMEEMAAAINFLIEMSEAMLIHVVMACVSNKFPFIIERIEESKIDPNNPMQYRLSIDINKLDIS